MTLFFNYLTGLFLAAAAAAVTAATVVAVAKLIGGFLA